MYSFSSDCSSTAGETREERTEALFDAIAQAANKDDTKLENLTLSDLLPESHLVEHYAKALKGSLTPRPSEESPEIGSNKVWREGDRCVAKFSEDGLFYPGRVLICKEWRDSCVVKYDGYGNEEEVPCSDIFQDVSVKAVRGKKRKKGT